MVKPHKESKVSPAEPRHKPWPFQVDEGYHRAAQVWKVHYQVCIDGAQGHSVQFLYDKERAFISNKSLNSLGF